MKRKFLVGALSALAVFALVGCGGTTDSSVPATSDTPATSETPTTSEVVNAVTSVTVTGADGATAVRAGKTLQLTATLAGTGTFDKTVTWSVDSEIATISDGGVLTGVSVGTVKVTATSTFTTSVAGELSITVKAEYDEISSLTKAGEYKMKGTVAALTTKGFIMHDGTAGAYVHLNAEPTNYAIGDYVSVEETLADGTYMPYNGFYQFTNAAVVTKLEGTAPAVTEAVALTKEIADGWTSVSNNPTAIQKYKWTTNCAASGSYTVLPFAGSDTVIENTYTPESLTVSAGVKYEVEGYFYGYSTKNKYASIALTKITAMASDPTSITIDNASDSVVAGKKMGMEFTVLPAGSLQEATWSVANKDTAVVDPLATIDATTGVLTAGTTTGTVVVTAKANANDQIVGSKEIKIVSSLNYTKVAAYTLVSSAAGTGAISDESAVLAIFTAGADTTTEGLSDIVTSTTNCVQAYAGFTGYLNLGMKLGKKDGYGSFTIGTTEAVGKVVIHTTGWTASDKVQIGVDDAQTPGVAYKTTGAEKTLTYEFGATKSIDVLFTERGFISSMEFYKVAA
ncbi:MAG: Ig-like domain-containing protein [Bacilli bacterium]|jgi:hypothetical protein|nr:Ig-like domain-containing protein [Bacilli bacterium]